LKNSLNNNNKLSFSLLHVNIRSLQKNFENFKEMLTNIQNSFKIICLTETWCREENILKDSNYQLPNYSVIYQMRSENKGGGGVCIFLHDSITFKQRHDLSCNTADCESLCIEVVNKTSKNILINVLYRQPAGKFKYFKDHLKHLFLKNKAASKPLYLAGDFNLNVLDYKKNKKVQTFINLLTQNFCIPLINRPTRVTRQNATAIDHIITNKFTDVKITTGILKANISDHFPVFLLSESEIFTQQNKKTVITKRNITDESTFKFKTLLSETDWDLVYQSTDASTAYDVFIKTFSDLYETVFPKYVVEMKRKTIQNPWMTKGLLKSSKRKQRLYEKFLKKRTFKNEEKYKKFKNLYETVRSRSKKLHYSHLISKYEGNIKKTWDIMKEIIGKSKTKGNNLPKRLFVDGNETFEKYKIASKINEYFVNVGPDLASKVSKSQQNFDKYLQNCNSIMKEFVLTVEEITEALNSLKINKSAGIDEITPNIIKAAYSHIQKPIIYIFNLSLEQGVFPEQLKIARVTPIFKHGDPSVISNYRPISILPCFSKIIERIMYNRLYKYLKLHNLLYENQFGFQAGNSTDHALLLLSLEIL
jgi:hypothetical protein